jgi:hypothetical protein
MEHKARNSRVDPEVIWGRLSDTASSSGRVGSSRPGRRGRPGGGDQLGQPSRSKASVTTTSTWLEVSSALSRLASHLRLTGR